MDTIKKEETFHFVGKQIRAAKVLCIDNNNANRGIIPLYEALRIAEDSGLDLVQMNNGNKGSPPTCKIMNYGKFKYEQSKKDKEAAKKQRESEVKTKEIKFRPSTDINDLRVKAKHAEKFLNEGHRVKVSLVFKGREISHQDLGRETFNVFVDLLPDADFLSAPSFENKEMSVILIKGNGVSKTG